MAWVNGCLIWFVWGWGGHCRLWGDFPTCLWRHCSATALCPSGSRPRPQACVLPEAPLSMQSLDPLKASSREGQPQPRDLGGRSLLPIAALALCRGSRQRKAGLRPRCGQRGLRAPPEWEGWERATRAQSPSACAACVTLGELRRARRGLHAAVAAGGRPPDPLALPRPSDPPVGSPSTPGQTESTRPSPSPAGGSGAVLRGGRALADPSSF